MTTVALAVGLGAVAVLVAWVIRARTGTDAPTQARWAVPTQLDREDFTGPELPWLVAVFTSATCLSCAATWTTAQALAAPDVAVQKLDAVADRSLHERYGIEAVPCLVLADAAGTVRASFLGEPTRAELLATMAALRGEVALRSPQGARRSREGGGGGRVGAALPVRPGSAKPERVASEGAPEL